jgi:hypothetical protein
MPAIRKIGLQFCFSTLLENPAALLHELGARA